MHQTLAASSALQSKGSDPAPSISVADPSAPQALPTAGAPVLAGVQQATTPVDTSRQPVNEQAPAARPQLSVQEYSLPEARNAEFLQEAEVQAETADLASVPTASAGHSRNHSSQMEDNAALEATPPAGTIAGKLGILVDYLAALLTDTVSGREDSCVAALHCCRCLHISRMCLTFADRHKDADALGILPCFDASVSQTRLATEIVQSPDSQQSASRVLPDD